MAVAQQASSGEVEPEFCENAREYVLERLSSEDPVTPTELAEDYGCTPNHMRKTLASLVESGEAERVSRGHYVLPDGEANAEIGDSMESNEQDDVESDFSTASTAELYQRQHTDPDDVEDQENTGQNVGSDDPDDDPGGEIDAVGPALPMEPKKLGMILAAGLVLWLAYRSLGGGSSGSQSSSSSNESEDEEDLSEITGGLVS